jgi:hypothetical protein
MRELQREWWLVVVQLDHLHRLGQLSLSSLVYYCREPAASMQLLASIAVSRLCGLGSGVVVGWRWGVGS